MKINSKRVYAILQEQNLWREKRHAVVQENNILLTEVSNAIALESNL